MESERNQKSSADLLANLDEVQWQAVLRYLNAAPSDHPELGEGCSRDVLRFLAEFFAVTDFEEESIDTVVPSQDGQREKVQARLREAAQTQKVVLARKGHELTWFHHQFYLNSRIVTDARPVFDDGCTIQGWLVSHILKLSVKTDQQVKELFIGLEPQDLDSLSEQIEQAKTRQEQLVKTFSRKREP